MRNHSTQGPKGGTREPELLLSDSQLQTKPFKPVLVSLRESPPVGQFACLTKTHHYPSLHKFDLLYEKYIAGSSVKVNIILNVVLRFQGFCPTMLIKRHAYAKKRCNYTIPLEEPETRSAHKLTKS